MDTYSLFTQLRNGLFLLSLGVFLTIPAFANQPPGGSSGLAVLSILPVMIMLTGLGDGYRFLAQHGKRKHGALKIIGGCLGSFWALTHGSAAFITALIFGGFACWRGIILLSGGIRNLQRNTATESQARIAPWRLIMAGGVLIPVTLFLSGMTMAYEGYWPMAPEEIEEELTELTAFHLAFGQYYAAVLDTPQFHERLQQEWRQYSWRLMFRRPRHIRVNYSEDRQHFTIYVPPAATSSFYSGLVSFPFFPFNYFISHPSYRSDETGQIRMVHTHHKYAFCPADAPVVKRLEKEDVRAIFLEVRWEKP